MLVTTFGYQVIIPTLRTYLNSDHKKLRLAILIGSLIPLTIYLIWEFLILGIIPVKGDPSLTAIFHSGQPQVGLTHALQQLLHIKWIALTFRGFSAFAIATSFLGVSLSLFDFLRDGLHKQGKKSRLPLVLLTFAPPLFFALAYPKGFILALEYAGVFVAILLILYPALMAWSGRYVLRISHGYRVACGKISLVALMLFAFVVIAVEIIKKF